MTAIDLLMNDHKEAMGMIEQLENSDMEQLETAAKDTTAVRSKEDLFNKLKNALTLHTQLEERVFYPALESFDETHDLVQESYQEHQDVDDLLNEMAGLSPTDEEWMDMLTELKDSLEHHVDEEEHEMFPKAEKLLGQNKLQDMGRQMQEMKGGRTATATMKRK